MGRGARTTHLDRNQRTPRIVLEISEQCISTDELQGVRKMGFEPFNNRIGGCELVKLRCWREQGASERLVLSNGTNISKIRMTPR